MNVLIKLICTYILIDSSIPGGDIVTVVARPDSDVGLKRQREGFLPISTSSAVPTSHLHAIINFKLRYIFGLLLFCVIC